MKKSLYLILLVVFSTLFLVACSNKPKEAKGMTNKVAIDINNYGVIEVELYENVAPITVANFKDLVSKKFYDGLSLHRIMKGFMIQGGDPLGNGTGGSDNNIVGEFAANGIQNNLSHKRGVISMARSNNPNSASSQFFIMHQDGDFLDGNYAAFGMTTKGIEVVDKICDKVEVVDDNGTVKEGQKPIINRIYFID